MELASLLMVNSIEKMSQESMVSAPFDNTSFANTSLCAAAASTRGTAGPNTSQALELAFKAFSELSSELTQTYQALEDQVRSLTHELEATHAERLRELADKERLAHRLQKLLQLLPGGVLVLNGQGLVAECNAAARELLGEPLAGEAWLNIIRERFAPRRDDGHEISLVNGRRVSLLSRSLDEEPGQLILITDQTETRQLQQRLGRHQRLLEMGKMVSSLAHQIRTPLSAAILYASHLNAADSGVQVPTRFKRAHSRLLSRLHNMERQVKDMLVFARGETVLDETLSTTALLVELRLAAETLLPSGDALCEWVNEVPERAVQCNKDALVGALINLLENALQHGGDSLQLRVVVASMGEQALRLYVEDNGPGIEAASLKQVSEPFYTTRAQGTGLGLAVVEVVARAHQGRFFIENRSDGAPDDAAVCGVRAGFVLPCVVAGAQ